MSIPYTKTDTTISVVLDFTPQVIPSSHPNFDKICKAVKNAKTTEAQLLKLIDIPKAIETFTGGNVTIVNGRLFYKGYEVKSSLASLILKMVRQGEAEAAKPFELFLENAFQNPDPRAALDLYEWVADSGLPITSDGCILAWKAVRADYKSIHSGPRGHLDHSIGNTVSEPRHECDADPDRTCSRGLHFCSAPYLKQYAGGGHRVVAVKINPRDVVAFPKDYGWQKGRACEYVVVGEVPQDKVKEFYPQGLGVTKHWDAPKTPARDASGRFIRA